VNREEEEEDGLRGGPRRDDPGDVIQEIELEHDGVLGIARDFDNDIMWITHTLLGDDGLPFDAFFTGYRLAGNEVEVIDDIHPDQVAIAGGYHEGVFYSTVWGPNNNMIRYDLDGNNIGDIDIGNPENSYLMAFTVDPERAYLFAITFPEISIHILDINNDFEQVAYLDNLLDGRNAEDFRGRIFWVPEHDDGHLWVSWRPDPNDQNFYAWQVNVIEDGEDWGWEEVQHFVVDTDVRSYGIAHDGQDLWIGRQLEASVAITDDGISEPNWLFLDPEDGEIPGGEEVVIEALITPGELEPGMYELLLQLQLDDPEQPSIEMGIVMSYEVQVASIAGVITDAANDEQLEGVRIDMDYFVMSRFSGEDGTYAFEDLPPADYVLTFTAPDYLPATREVTIEEEDVEDVDVSVALLHAEFNTDIREIEIDIAPDGESVVEFEVSNDGNGLLTYTCERTLEGGADVDPWTLRESLMVGEEVDDSRIEAVAYIDGQYFVAGGNDRNPTIYIIDREGALVDTFAQPTEEDNSMKEMAWDGELIWMADRENIYGFTTEGEVEVTFESPFSPASCMAWDPDRECLWIAGTTTDILAIDRDGNQLQEIDRQGMRMYGLAYWPDDPDDYCLYIFSKDRDNNMQTVHRCNPELEQEDDNIEFVTYLEPELGGNPNAAFITNTYDVYSWVFMTISNASGNAGGDRIDIWQLDSRRDWFLLEPMEGVIEPDDSQLFTLTLSGVELIPETYEGFLVFTHDGIGGETIIPVTLNVILGPVPAVRTLALVLGWNMVSVNLQPDEENVVVLTRPLVENDLLILMKDSEGRFYSPEFGFNNIPGWFAPQGYMMKMEEAAELDLAGMTVLWNDPIALEDGWQIIAYYPRIPIDAVVALSRIEEQLLMAKDVLGRFYNVEWGFSNMGDMIEGQGYLVKVDGAVELIYRITEEGGDDDELASVNRQRSVHRQHRRLPVHPVTGVNMSLLILSDPNLNAEIGVYAEDVLVGSGILKDGACGIAVWGDDPATEEIDGALNDAELSIKVWDVEIELPAVITWVQGEETYVTDEFAALSIECAPDIPTEFGLDTPYPNPFNSSVQLGFKLDEPGMVRLAVYDLTGREVAQLVNDNLTAGHHAVVWDAIDQPSGIYLVRLNSGSDNKVAKMMLIR